MTDSDLIRREAEHLISTFCAEDAGRSVAIAASDLGLAPIGMNAETQRPAASVMKVPLVMALYDKAHEGDVDLDARVPLLSLGRTRYASILAAFDADRRFSVRELAALSLIVSDNPATVHIQTLVTFDEVNSLLKRCGCSRDARMAAGFSEVELGAANRVNQLSALDAIKIFDVLHSQPRYAPIVKVLENNLRNNRIPALLPDDVVVTHKTGSLLGVVNNIGRLSYADKSLTLAVLADGQRDAIATSRDTGLLAKALAERLLGVPEI
jgi:beta-lactamase class A